MLLQLKVQDHGYAEFVTEGTKFGLFERAKLPELIGRDARAGGPGQCGGPAGPAGSCSRQASKLDSWLGPSATSMRLPPTPSTGLGTDTLFSN